MPAMIATSERIIEAIQSSIDEALDPLPLSLNSTNLQVAWLTSSLSSGAMTDVSKDTSTVTRDTDKDARIENL